MWKGAVESIYIASTAEGPVEARDQVVAIPGAGLEGDRYALKRGTFYKPEPAYELTLIEAEVIEALRRDYNVELSAGEARRNIVTRGVPLNHLVGKEFAIGTVRVRDIRSLRALRSPAESDRQTVDRRALSPRRVAGADPEPRHDPRRGCNDSRVETRLAASHRVSLGLPDKAATPGIGRAPFHFSTTKL